MFRGKCFHLISFWAPVPVTTYYFIKICKYICFGSIDHLPSHRLYVWVINYLIHIFSFEFYSGSSWWTNPCFKIWTSLIFTIHISPKLPRFSVFTHHYDTRYMRIWVYVITISHEEIFLYMLNVDKHFIFSKKAHYQKINKQTKSFSKKKSDIKFVYAAIVIFSSELDFVDDIQLIASWLSDGIHICNIVVIRVFCPLGGNSQPGSKDMWESDILFHNMIIIHEP